MAGSSASSLTTKSKSKSKSEEQPGAGRMGVDVDTGVKADKAHKTEGVEKNDKVQGGEKGETEEDDVEVAEGEYEVEAIVDHRQADLSLLVYKQGKYQYLVAWKGYGAEFNTWEPEENVENSRFILDAYWATQRKKPTKNGPVKRARSTTSMQRDKPIAKVARVSNGTRPSRAEPGDEDEEATFEDSYLDNMDQYLGVKDWEELVESVDTVERAASGKLLAFITAIGGEKAAVPTELVYKRCPQKMLHFYESHLKWRSQA